MPDRRAQLEPGPDADAGPASRVEPLPLVGGVGAEVGLGPESVEIFLRQALVLRAEAEGEASIRQRPRRHLEQGALVALDRQHVFGVEAGVRRQRLAPMAAEGEAAAGDDRAGPERRTFDVLVDRREHAAPAGRGLLDVAADRQHLGDEARLSGRRRRRRFRLSRRLRLRLGFGLLSASRGGERGAAAGAEAEPPEVEEST